RYRGVNVLVLWAAASQRGYKTQLWATYKQWRELGAQVRQGEKSTAVVFWKFYGDDHDSEAENIEDETTESSRKRCFARAYHVFNADQVEGFSLPTMPALPEAQRIQQAEDFFHRTGARIIETGTRAYYDSNADEIHMPPFSLFKKADYFYSTLAHETIHNAAPRIMPRLSPKPKQTVVHPTRLVGIITATPRRLGVYRRADNDQVSSP